MSLWFDVNYDGESYVTCSDISNGFNIKIDIPNTVVREAIDNFEDDYEDFIIHRYLKKVPSLSLADDYLCQQGYHEWSEATKVYDECCKGEVVHICKHCGFHTQKHLIKRYCIAFVFTNDYEKVLLVKKEKPEWQKGLWNGVGGKLKPNELPVEGMNREFAEEVIDLVFNNKLDFYAKLNAPGNNIFL